jgi:hypothetical protein
MQALEKLTLVYLALQERAEKLQADKDAMFFENQALLHKSKDLAACNRFLQEERDNLAKQVETLKSAYKQSQESNKGEVNDYKKLIRDLKECIEELEGQLVALTPKEQRIDEPQDGYEAEKRVCRAGFKASEKPNDADEKPVILLANQYGAWVKSCFFVFNDSAKIKQLMFTAEIKEAKQFASLAAVGEFLSGCIGETLQTSYHHPVTLQLVTSEQPADEKPELYHTIYDNPA